MSSDPKPHPVGDPIEEPSRTPPVVPSPARPAGPAKPENPDVPASEPLTSFTVPPSRMSQPVTVSNSNESASSDPSNKESEPVRQGTHNPEQFETAERARQDAQSERVDTDLYNTSGNKAKPPKTTEKDSSREG